MSTLHRIISGDSRRMEELKDASVHLVITSPPYWQLKDYGSGDQIGFHDDYESYINNLNLVWKESYRVLENGCRLCINIGDQFARAVYYGRYKVIPIRTEIIKFCETIGFDYMGAIIWQKVTTTNTTGGATIMGSFPFPRNGILKLDYEFILIFKKPGKPEPIDPEIKERSKMTKKEWNTFFQGHWNFSGARQNSHIAMFPEELPRRLVKMFSFVGDVVLDPFLGSGTTSLAAKNLDRNSVGYEINREFIPMIKEKLSVKAPNMLQKTRFKFSRQKPLSIDLQKEIEKLPYIFKDPHKLDKKIDIKKRRFGSRIDKTEKKREEYFKVERIISPERLQLKGGKIIRLAGIVTIEAMKEKAEEFLAGKIKKQNVFLRYDKLRVDDEQNPLCYLYLQNKTFINAHLIKSGLVAVDRGNEYSKKKRFVKLEEERQKA